MAVKGSSLPLVTVHPSAELNRPVFGVLKLRKGQLPLKRRLTVTATIKSSRRLDLVFEDHSKGIICYKNDRGEIICEGFDEGPCLRQPYLPTPYNRWDAEIVELLQRKWLQMVESDNDGSTVLEESINGFNTFC